MKIAFYGDSLTAGIPGASYVDKIRAALPQHTILNYGKINDTPLSLYRRIRSQHLDRALDVAFIFVGVNDLLIERSWLFSRLRQHWARSDDEFCQHYNLLLETVCSFARRVICISPLFIGEDFDSDWQQCLGQRAAMIARLTTAQAPAEYLDLRSLFIDSLRDTPVLPNIEQNLMQSVWDGLAHRGETSIAQIAAARGLHYTIDGVHLNLAGAQIVAAECLNILRSDSGES
ncbi:MAG: hypothetical protein K8L99_19150 [Anaerolineae bacterium]|nr:hypothetical protein [Anaerolineae bacterium]